MQKLAYQSEAELVGDYSIPPLTQTLDGLAEDFNNGIILKAVYRGEIVGSVRVRSIENTSHIGRLMVNPAFQNQGIGTALLLAAEKVYPNNKFELFTSDLSVKNLSLYAKNEYKVFKQESLNESVNFVFLEKYSL